MAKAIEKLGDSIEGPGYLLLGLLAKNGWDVGVTAGFAGDGIIVIAEHPELGRVSKHGESVAHVAPDVAEACLALSADGRLH